MTEQDAAAQTDDRITVVQIRWMIRRDLPEVLEIECDCFDHPWIEEEFRSYLKERNVIGMVAENPKGQILGFTIYELESRNLHMLNLAIHQLDQRKGIGRTMLDRLKHKLHQQGRRAIVTEVRESNSGCHKFLNRCGFKAIGILRNHYEFTDDDAYLFEFRLDSE